MNNASFFPISYNSLVVYTGIRFLKVKQLFLILVGSHWKIKDHIQDPKRINYLRYNKIKQDQEGPKGIKGTGTPP